MIRHSTPTTRLLERIAQMVIIATLLICVAAFGEIVALAVISFWVR